MTCQELHCYLENPLRVDIYMYRESLPAAVLEHLGTCAECARLFEEQKSLGISLNMVRDAAPRVPAPLDAKVLANYRLQMSEPESFGHRGRSLFSNSWLLWGAVTAAVIVLVAAAMLLSHGDSPITVKRIVSDEARKPVIVQQQRAEVAAKEPQAEHNPIVPAGRVQRTATVASRSPLPPGFASLMYCDEMSCTGQMEVIRVELPPAGRQVSGPAASPTMAEVLVGADGIARGIRIVQ